MFCCHFLQTYGSTYYGNSIVPNKNLVDIYQSQALAAVRWLNILTELRWSCTGSGGKSRKLVFCDTC